MAQCEKWCGLNYCDENGCAVRDRHYVPGMEPKGTGDVPVSVEITTGGERIIGAEDDYQVIEWAAKPGDNHPLSKPGIKMLADLTDVISAKDKEIAELKAELARINEREFDRD